MGARERAIKPAQPSFQHIDPECGSLQWATRPVWQLDHEEAPGKLPQPEPQPETHPGPQPPWTGFYAAFNSGSKRAYSFLTTA